MVIPTWLGPAVKIARWAWRAARSLTLWRVLRAAAMPLLAMQHGITRARLWWTRRRAHRLELELTRERERSRGRRA
jgi:hypothetical protein